MKMRAMRGAIRWSTLIVGIILGVIGVATFNVTMDATNTTAFCISCHELEQHAFAELKESPHWKNRAGVKVGCPDCHVPKAFLPKLERKLISMREVWGHWTGKIDTPAKYEAHRLEMAQVEWARLKANGARECLNCHNPEGMSNKDKAFVKDMHLGIVKAAQQICTDCHKGVAHKAPEDKKAEGSPAGG